MLRPETGNSHSSVKWMFDFEAFIQIPQDIDQAPVVNGFKWLHGVAEESLPSDFNGLIGKPGADMIPHGMFENIHRWCQPALPQSEGGT
jgi:hypothetical protein